MRHHGETALAWILLHLLAAITLSVSSQTMAAEIYVDRDDADRPPPKNNLILPFIMSTETLDTGVGASYNIGLFDAASGVFLAGYVTVNGSWGVIGALDQFQLAGSRWFMDPSLVVARNTEQRFYGDLASSIGEVEGGTNDSGPDDFIQGPGWNNFVEVPFNYLIPTGDGRERIVHRYETDRGLLVEGPSGGRGWNPGRSGRSTLTITPFYQLRTIGIDDENIVQFPPPFELEIGDTAEHETNGIKLALEYDNRDFEINPERGSWQSVSVSRDFGWFDSFNAWTSIDADYRKYLSLGRTKTFRQRVFAFNYWTAYIPTFERTLVGDVVVIDGAPPSNKGATLGGPVRFRAYPLGRYSDAAAVYYSGEIRLIPGWDPISNWKFASKIPWRWWQWVAFAELGRVAPTWDLRTLHEDMKWTAGASLRAMVGSRIFRFTLATSEESTQFLFLINQSF